MKTAQFTAAGTRTASPFDRLVGRVMQGPRHRPVPPRKLHQHFRVVEVACDESDPGTVRVVLVRRGRPVCAAVPSHLAAGLKDCRGTVIHASVSNARADRASWQATEWRDIDERDGGQMPWLELAHPDWSLRPDLLEELLRFVDSLSPDAARLVHAVFERDEDLQAFLQVPASVDQHHCWIGGLLEHTLEVASIAEERGRSAGADCDLMLAGAILHDVGKVREYQVSCDRRVSRSEEGGLLFHKMLGKTLVDLACHRVAADPKLATRLGHCLVAADGPFHMGLPRRKLIEATLLGEADAISASRGVSRH